MVKSSPLIRMRLGLALVSGTVIVVELALMRLLAMRFWDHVAHMVIGVALLGFGLSGVWLSLARAEGTGHLRQSLCRWSWAFAFSILFAEWVSRFIPLNLASLAWDMGQAAHILCLEAVLTVPFLCAAIPLGLALMDRPERVAGHNAANLFGAGAGALLAVVLLNLIPPMLVLYAGSGAALTAAVLFIHRYSPRSLATALGMAVAAGAVMVAKPDGPVFSQYKTLSLVRQMPDTRILATKHGVLGRIDAVQGPALHYAPGLSLQDPAPVPDQVILCSDGDQSDAVYRWDNLDDWAFLDQTTAASAYWIRHAERPSAEGPTVTAAAEAGTGPAVLVVGAGGGAHVGLARYHRAAKIDALEMNPSVKRLVTGPLAAYGGDVLEAATVRPLVAEARGYLATHGGLYDIIQVPVMHSFGAGGAGLLAAGQSHLYTVEGIADMIEHLAEHGVLSLTCWARTPPREGLRLFATCIAAAEQQGLDPRRHLAMIRSWATVTVLVSPRPWSGTEMDRLRSFCMERGFDVCHLPGLDMAEANCFHVLDRPRYAEAAQALLGPAAEAFMAHYPFRIDPPTDNSPYFHAFFKWSSLGNLRRHLGESSRSFMDVGYLFLVAALIQVLVLAGPLFVVPLLVAGRRGGVGDGRTPTVLYFLGIGVGFMLFELGALQRLTLYLAHPVYAASLAIASFLVFAGLGSLSVGASRARAEARSRQAARWSAGIGVVLACLLGPWLNLTAGWPLPLRMAIAALSVAPLAFLLGRMLPLGLALIGDRRGLIPWGWAVNGLGSVAAALSAPLLGMALGGRALILIAALCYALVACVVPAFGRRIHE